MKQPKQLTFPYWKDIKTKYNELEFKLKDIDSVFIPTTIEKPKVQTKP